MNYFFIFLLLVVAELFYFRLADRFNIIDRPNERSSHTQITLRGGGIVFYFGACVYFIGSGFEYPWFMGGLTLITAVSFADDVQSVSQKIRLLVHFTAVGMLFYQLDMGSFNWWYIPAALLVSTGILNAFNFMDGINGITGGYSLVVLGLLSYVNKYQVYFVEQQLLWVMLLAVAIFCIFNFRKKAKCFAGDVGSVGIAFIILFCLGKLILQTGDFTYILFLGVYGMDSVLTIIHRMLLHENIGEPHRKHVYQLMANELKMSHVVVSSIYIILQLMISFGLLLVSTYKWWYFGGMLLILVVTYVMFKKKYYYLHADKAKTHFLTKDSFV